MFRDPEIGISIHINNQKFTFIEAADAPDIIYAEIGRKAKVYRVLADGKPYALKAFKPKYRTAEMVINSKTIASYQHISALAVANRLVITPEAYPDLVGQNPALEYSILMPWVEGKSWFNYITGKIALAPGESLRLARALIDAIYELEQNTLAHCDLSSSNFIFKSDFSSVQLIDIEDMFGIGLIAPKEKSKGTGGYAPSWLKQNGVWESGGDRFSSAILVSEVLGWQFEDIRNASNGDAFFADGEFGNTSKRFRLMTERLNQLQPELSRLFKNVWYAESFEECSRIADWKHVLDAMRVPELEITPDHLEFSLLDLRSKPINLPTAEFRIRNSGNGKLSGRVTSNAPWLSVTPAEFANNENHTSEHIVTLKANAPVTKNQQTYQFVDALTIQYEDIVRPIPGSYSVALPRASMRNWVIAICLAGALFLGFSISRSPNDLFPAWIGVKSQTPTSTITPHPSSTPTYTKTAIPSRTPTSTSTSIPLTSILYSENFENGKVNDWDTYYGDWAVLADGENHYWDGSGPTNYPQAWMDLDKNNSANWTDYAFQFRLRFVKGSIFICVRSDQGSAFYNAYINSHDDWVSFADYNGTDYKTFGDKSASVQTNKWYTIRFEVQGNSLRLFIDDRLVTSGTRNSHQRGGIGFYMGGGDELNIDDLLVWSLSQQ